MHGYIGNKDAILARFRRSRDNYCIDVLTQVSATTKALEGGGALALWMITSCTALPKPPNKAAPSPKRSFGEASAAIARLVRS